MAWQHKGQWTCARDWHSPTASGAGWLAIICSAFATVKISGLVPSCLSEAGRLSNIAGYLRTMHLMVFSGNFTGFITTMRKMPGSGNVHCHTVNLLARGSTTMERAGNVCHFTRKHERGMDAHKCERWVAR